MRLEGRKHAELRELSLCNNVSILSNVAYSLWLIVNIVSFLYMDVKLKIGKRIREIRERANMSQKDLAYSADLDRSYVASVESGQRNISIVNLEKLANSLGVTLSELFKGV